MAYTKPDQASINKLVAQIKRGSPALKARKLLMQQYVACGWFKEAGEQAMAVLTLEPTNVEAKNTRELEQGYAALTERANLLYQEAKLLQHLKGIRASDFTELISSFAAMAKGVEISDSATKAKAHRSTSTVANAVVAVKTSSSNQGANPTVASRVARPTAHEKAGNAPNPRKLVGTVSRKEGRATHVSGNVITAKPQKTAKDVAAEIAAAYKSNKTRALDLAFEDLKSTIESKTRDPSNDREADRRASLIRMNAVKGFLSSKLQPLTDAAQMHVEHEILRRRYANADTMGLEPVSEIPRAHFWVSEDAYAWDMEELAAAISSNRGIMRNPLSRLMFHPRDVRAIIQHPLGKHLAAMQVDQNELREGVREETIKKLENLAQKLLDDETEDFEPSHRAVEAFVAYLATLPDAEQKAIDGLWVPARDSHTGMQFDMSVGQSVRDAQNNLVCFHKTGDLLSQAVSYLRGEDDYYARYY